MNSAHPAGVAGGKAHPAFHIAQELMLGRTAAERDLCCAITGGVVADDETGALACAAPATISFDRLFNAFYESYWLKQVDFRRVHLALRCEGRGFLRIWRDTAGADGAPRRSLVASVPLTGHDFSGVAIDVPLGQATDHPGVIWFEIEAEAGFAVLGGAWSIDAPPRRAARVVIATCTMRYGAYMPSLFAALEEDPGLDGIAGVIVVNNNPASYAPQLAARFPRVAERLRVINQPNTGGSGGFTRGIIEAEADLDATHIALLDDDVVVPFGMLGRVARLAGFVKDGTVIGGAMLDQLHPHMMSSTGEFYDPRAAKPNAPYRDTDLRTAGWKAPFLAGHRGQWNGWWLAVYPANIAERIGYPVPLFLKWDDIEYGVRASAAGLYHVTFPGVAVWHHPFSAKLITWEGYFNTRNELITRAVAFPGERRSSVALLRRASELMLSRLLTYRYYQCRLILEACRDYRVGPEALDGPVVPHLEYLKRLARTEPDHETAPSGTRVREAPQPRLAGNGLGAGVALLWNLVVRPAARRSNDHAFDDRHADWQHYFGLDVVHIDDPSLPHAMILRRDQRLAWRLWLEMLRELVLLGLSNRRTLARWRRAMPALTSRAHWIEYFENNGASLDAASEAPEKRSTVR